MFSNQHRQEVKEANPELTMVEIAKKLGEMWRGMEQDVRKEWEEKATSAKDHYMVGFACVQPALSGRVGGCAVAVTAHAPARRTRKSCGWSSGKQCRRGRMASNDVVSPPSPYLLPLCNPYYLIPWE